MSEAPPNAFPQNNPHMLNAVESILVEISQATVLLNKTSKRLAVNLFDYRDEAVITFNGFQSLKAYDMHCESLLDVLKKQIDQAILEEGDKVVALQTLDLLMHQATSQKQRYFPKKRPEDWYLKLDFQGRDAWGQLDEDALQYSINRFLSVQERLLDRCRSLLKHRITYLRGSLAIRGSNKVLSYGQRVTEAVSHDVVSEPQFLPSLQWNRSNSDLLELLISMHRSNAISSVDGPLRQKDLIESFSRLLNKPLKFTNQTISAMKRRKKAESSYTFELHNQYRIYCDTE